MSSWATQSMKEYPFWKEDMTAKEFEKEREYYLMNFEKVVLNGKYVPLWKQALEEQFYCLILEEMIPEIECYETCMGCMDTSVFRKTAQRSEMVRKICLECHHNCDENI